MIYLYLGLIMKDIQIFGLSFNNKNSPIHLFRQDIQLILSVSNGRTSKSEESHFKSDEGEIVTAIESILWRNDRKKRSQSSLIKTSSTSSGESKMEESKKVDTNISSLPSAPDKDSKKIASNLFR